MCLSEKYIKWRNDLLSNKWLKSSVLELDYGVCFIKYPLKEIYNFYRFIGYIFVRPFVVSKSTHSNKVLIRKRIGIIAKNEYFYYIDQLYEEIKLDIQSKNSSHSKKMRYMCGGRDWKGGNK